MAFTPLTFTKSWRNSRDFPTYEPDETRVRDDLQLLHDETRDSLNALIAGLNDPAAAGSIPFAPGGGLMADTVEQAIREVYEAVRKAAAGQIPDGTIRKEKLHEELLERIYGGRLWVALDSPGPGQNPDSDFPVGQLWLQPGFTLENLAADGWTVTGGRAAPVDDGWQIEPDGTQAVVTAEQNLESIGAPGERVLVWLRADITGSYLPELSLILGGLEYDLLAGGGAFEAALDQTGSLELMAAAQWPYEKPGGSFCLRELAVLPVEALEKSLPHCHPMADWAGFAASHVPFTSFSSPWRLFVQTAAGVWEDCAQKVLPVERGGTGLTAYQPGQLLYADAHGALQPLTPPKKPSLLHFRDGQPQWKTQEETVQALGSLRVSVGTYTGTGQPGSITLPLQPRFLYIRSENGPYGLHETHVINRIRDNPVFLAQGGSAAEAWEGSTDQGTNYYLSRVKLDGSTLHFSVEGGENIHKRPAGLCNGKGTVYTWLALY